MWIEFSENVNIHNTHAPNQNKRPRDSTTILSYQSTYSVVLLSFYLMQCIVNAILARKHRKFMRRCVDGEFENGILWLPVFKAPLKHRYFSQWHWDWHWHRHWPTRNYKVNQSFIKYSIILNLRMSGQRWSKCPFQYSGAVDIL